MFVVSVTRYNLIEQSGNRDMGTLGVIAGIVIGVAIIIFLISYTNLFEVSKPGFESSMDNAKEVISKIESKDVVKEAEKITEHIRNATSKIEVKNPLEP